jgi:UDP-N-acetylmuramoyl-L-alanyl-D-glutamate--2,6-diaminopimelate ligase
MTWAQLAATLAEYGQLADQAARPATPDVVVAGIAHDSRRVAPGDVFVAVRGLHADAGAFAQQALERGAVLVVSDHDRLDIDAARWVHVRDGRVALALLAAAFHGHPSRQLKVVGITGTNGKTTTAHLVASIFEAAGTPCGIVGTVGYRIGGAVRAAGHTTPEAPDVQRLLREMVDQGCGACAMEVSSHALALRRVDGMAFAAAVFTNLTRDHLDFHGDMESYFQAKRRLFEMLPPGAPALINADDPRASAVRQACTRPITYGIQRAADIAPGPLSFSLDGLRFDIRTPRGTVRVESALVGRPNVYNILAAVSLATALDLPFDAIERGVASLAGVPGRFEVVSRAADGITVVVDYAHTDDALRNLLETARPLARGRLITVFGCGGNRDRTKRPLMGAVASRLSDVIVITSDNPRHEDPLRIIEEIERGITSDTRRPGGEDPLAIPDRQEAITNAIALARPGDLVIIAGKGHERYQVVGDTIRPFDDVAVARAALARGHRNSGVV